MLRREHRVALVLCVILVALLGSTGESCGQFTGGGVKIGWNHATFTGERAEAANADPINGFLLGGFVRFGVSGGFSVQPELLFSRKGAEADTLGTRGTIKLNYVEAPILLRYTIPVRSSVLATVFAGPAIAGRLSSDAEATRFGRRVTTSVDDEVKVFDSSIVLGFEIQFPGDRRGVTVEGRYTQGLSEIDDTDSDLKVKNRVFSIVVGLWFGKSLPDAAPQ